jgi:hypothetical protein
VPGRCGGELGGAQKPACVVEYRRGVGVFVGVDTRGELGRWSPLRSVYLGRRFVLVVGLCSRSVRIPLRSLTSSPPHRIRPVTRSAARHAIRGPSCDPRPVMRSAAGHWIRATSRDPPRHPIRGPSCDPRPAMRCAAGHGIRGASWDRPRHPSRGRSWDPRPVLRSASRHPDSAPSPDPSGRRMRGRSRDSGPVIGSVSAAVRPVIGSAPRHRIRPMSPGRLVNGLRARCSDPVVP